MENTGKKHIYFEVDVVGYDNINVIIFKIKKIFFMYTYIIIYLLLFSFFKKNKIYFF